MTFDLAAEALNTAKAEIIRLTARVAEYDRVCANLVAHWDSTDWVNKPHTVEKIAAIRAQCTARAVKPQCPADLARMIKQADGVE